MLVRMAAAAALLSLAPAWSRDAAWKQGTLLSVKVERAFACSHQTDEYDPYHMRGLVLDHPEAPVTHFKRVAVYRIDEGDAIEVAQQALRWRWSKPYPVNEHSTIAYADDGSKLLIRDSHGKSHTLAIVARIAKSN